LLEAAVVDEGVLRRRLDALLQYLELLRPFAAVSRDEFVRDPRQHDLAERYLHLAAECALDIANHVIADAGFEAPETYRAAFEILERHGVIDSDLARRLQAWAGFRNILVHGYLDVDHGLSWDALTRDLGDLRQLAAVAAKLL
jgi:uncharacterized protein YutE (UPF0331/DUF86 family)